MENDLAALLERFLIEYPYAEGIMFHSMEKPMVIKLGGFSEELEKYKDIPMVSIDESYTTNFTFIITNSGTIIIFFVNKLNFISVYVNGEMPNKALAQRMYDSYKEELEKLVGNL